jgi:hypothetical protein
VNRADQRGFASSDYRSYWDRLVDLEQVGEREPLHGCRLVQDRKLMQENERRRREGRILKEKRDIQKKAAQLLVRQGMPTRLRSAISCGQE